MIRADVRQNRIGRKFAFVAFCLSAITATIGYGIWGYPGIPFAPVVVTVAFFFSHLPKKRYWDLVPKCALMGLFCAIAAISIRSEYEESANREFVRALTACVKECPIRGEVVSTSLSSFGLTAESVGAERLVRPVEIRVFATADSLNEGKHVEIS